MLTLLLTLLFYKSREQCDPIKEMSHMSNFEIFTPLSGNLKMLHFDANPVRI